MAITSLQEQWASSSLRDGELFKVSDGGSTSNVLRACLTSAKMPRRRLGRIHCERFSVSLTSLTAMQQRSGYWGSGSALTSKRSGGMPKKWMHLEFLTELVYDLIFPGQNAVQLSTTGELDDHLIDSTRSFSLFASVNKAQLEEEINLDCNTGRGSGPKNVIFSYGPKIISECSNPLYYV
jgi:hypothetical protein